MTHFFYFDDEDWTNHQQFQDFNFVGDCVIFTVVD